MYVLREMLSENNPHGIRVYVCGCARYMVFCVLALMAYFVCVGLTIGFWIVASPGYDFSTGCPKNNVDCNYDVKMKCYAGNLLPCFGFGILTFMGIWVVAMIIWALIYCSCALKLSYDETKTLIGGDRRG